VIGQRVAAFGCPQPRRGITGDGNLLAAKACLVANHGAGAALARQAVTHGDARWFALNRKVKPPTAAGGVSGGGHGSAPRLSIWAKCKLGLPRARSANRHCKGAQSGDQRRCRCLETTSPPRAAFEMWGRAIYRL